MLKVVPYQWWNKSHLLMGPLFLLIAVHTFFSAIPIILFSVLWWVLLVFTLLAIAAWLRTLILAISAPKKSRVIAINKDAQALDITLECNDKLTWKPGQFSHISVNKAGLTERHPYLSFSNDPFGNLNQSG